MMSDMTKIMKEAIDEVSALPESDQETIGRQLLSHMEKLRRLRVEIDRGERSLDSGQGRELDIDAVVAQAAGGIEPTARNPPFICAKKAGYAFSYNPPYALFRHGRAYPSHPRLSCCYAVKTWMPGT